MNTMGLRLTGANRSVTVVEVGGILPPDSRLFVVKARYLLWVNTAFSID